MLTESELYQRLQLAEMKVNRMMNLSIEAKACSLKVSKMAEQLKEAGMDLEGADLDLIGFAVERLITLQQHKCEEYSPTTDAVSGSEMRRARSRVSLSEISIVSPPKASPTKDAVDRLQGEVKRLREEADFTKQNLRQIIELKETEIESLKKQLAEKIEENRELQRQMSEARASALFLDGALKSKKAELDEVTAALADAREHLTTAPSAESPKTMSSHFVKVLTQSVEEKEVVNTELNEEHTDEETNNNSKGMAKLESILRVKDMVIEKLHRRLKNLESNATLDSTVRQLAAREAAFERESARLNSRIRELQVEVSDLKRGIPVAHKDSNIKHLDLAYMQQTVIRYLLYLQRGEIVMARALLPILCALCEADVSVSREILSGQHVPLPRPTP